MKKENNIYLISIIAIVAIVGIVSMITVTGKGSFASDSNYIGSDLAGEAFRSISIKPTPLPKDYVELVVAGNDLDFTFTNKAGNEYEVEIYSYDGNNVTFAEDLVFNNHNFGKGMIFILEEPGLISKFIEFRGSDLMENEAQFKDLSTGEYYEVSGNETIANTGIRVHIVMDDVVSFNYASKDYVYTKSGIKISFDSASMSFIEPRDDTFYVNVGYDAVDDEMTVYSPTSWEGTSEFDEGHDTETGVDSYGTSFIQEADEDSKLQLYFPIRPSLSPLSR